MDYKLCARILASGCSDDVKQLITLYQSLADHSTRLVFDLDKHRQTIKILEAENRLLKEDNAG